ncbi:MAG TPA: nickel-binding protein [Gaiellaceae bacterium]|nr:nickel-binding protein [Gaiellaceae bacterium]
MPVFLVERYAAGDQIGGLDGRLAGATEGSEVRWLASIVLPGEDACLCLFEAPSAAEVIAVNLRAGAGLDRVVEAVLVRGGPPAGPVASGC